MSTNKVYGHFEAVSDSVFSNAEQWEIYRGLGKASKVLQQFGLWKFLAQYNPSTGKFEGSVAMDAVTESVTIGTQADLTGSGTALTASLPGAVRVFTDDGGADLDTPDSVRGVQSRLLLTHTQAGCTIRSLQGQLKALTSMTFATGVYTAVQGYVELVGTLGVNSGATFSCFDASLELGGVMTVASGGEAYGIHVETTGAGTITNNGTCAAIGITKASGAASWPVGISIGASMVTTGISMGAVTTGILMNGVVTTGISITGNATDGLKISGGTVVDAIEIGACTNAINVSGTSTTGLLLAGATTNAISITGAPATAAISITACETIGLLIGTSTPATGISITAGCANAISITGTNTTSGISISGDQVLGVLFAATAAATAAYAITVPTSITLDKGLDMNVTSNGIVTSGITMQGTGTFTTGITLSATTMATGINIGATSTVGVTIGATATGLAVTGACSTAAISISGAEVLGLSINTSTPTDGINISAACANAIAISGANTVAGISISGNQVVGVLMAATAAADAAYRATVPTGITLGAGLDINATSTGIVTSGLTMQGTGTFTTGITLSATAMTTGITISAGSMTDAIKISGTTPVDGIEISSACSANAINLSGGSAIGLMVARGVTQPIRIGNWAGSSATGSAIVISAVTDALDTTQRNIVAVYGESIADLGNGIHANVGRFRYLVNGITCNHETYGLVGQIRAKNVTFGHMHAGLMGTLEIDTAATINGAYTYGVAGVIARLGCGTSILTCTKAVCGFSAIYNGGALAGSAGSYAYGVDSTTATTWTAALALNLCDNLLYAATGTNYECGVKAGAQTVTNPETLAAIIRIKIGSTLYYIPAYAADKLSAE